MEWARYDLGSGQQPHHNEFTRLGEYSLLRINKGDPFFFLNNESITGFRFNRVDDPSAHGSVFVAATKRASTCFGFTCILVRPIARKLVFIQSNAIQQVGRNLQITMEGALVGNLLCSVLMPVNATVSRLKEIVARKLLQLNEMTSSMPVVFTNEELIKSHPSSKVRHLFQGIKIDDLEIDKKITNGVVKASLKQPTGLCVLSRKCKLHSQDNTTQHQTNTTISS